MIDRNTVALAIFSQNMGRRKLPVGRFTVAVAGTQKRADARANDRLVAMCAAALVAAGRYIDLRRQRKARRQGRGGGRAMVVDKRVDARLRSLHKHLTSCVELYEGEDRGDEAQRLLDQYFPDGLGAVINAPYEEELVIAEHIAEAFNGVEAQLIEDLGARMFVDALDAVLPEYREVLALEDIVTATDVAEARNEMHLLMLRIVATILADHGDDPDALRALLAPIDDQDRRLAELYAARRRGASTGDADVSAADAAQAARDAEAERLAAGFDEEEAFDDFDLDPEQPEGAEAEGAEDAEGAEAEVAETNAGAPERPQPVIRPVPRGDG